MTKKTRQARNTPQLTKRCNAKQQRKNITSIKSFDNVTTIVATMLLVYLIQRQVERVVGVLGCSSGWL